VTNGEVGLCMDDNGDSTSNGNKVQIWACNGGASQQWTVESNGTIELGGSCLDVKGAGTTNGTLIDLNTCNGQANQQWKPTSSNSLENPVSGMCLSDPNASTTNGTQLIIAPCNGQIQQKWRPPYNGLAPAGALTSGLSGKCLDDANAASSNGNKIDISSCTAGAGQDWTVQADGTVRVFGKCLDVKGAGTANSTLVDLYTCVGQANQVWETGPSGYLVNPASGKCLDDPGSSTTNGTQLNIYTCVSGASNEVWTLPSTTVPATPTGLAVTAGPYTTTATIAGLTAGTAYTFTLTASNGVGSATTAATSAVTPGNETTWAYDQAGNITSAETDGLTTTSTYNTDEELVQAATAGGTTTACGYDADGDQTTADDQTYTYNGAGQLAKAVTPAGSFGYTYDAGGNVSATSLNGSALQGTAWDENSPLPTAVEDTSASGATTADYLYGVGGTLKSVTTATGSYDATVDWLGSVTGLVGSAGSQLTSTIYSAYGTPSTTGPLSAGIAVGYAGSYALPGGNGLDDMRARDYSPATGVFTSVDPDLIQTGQPYLYAADTPVALSDPTGLKTWGLCLSGTATGGLGVTGSLCAVIAFDPSTGELQIGRTETGGFATGVPSAGVGAGIQESNASQISELGGPFGYLGGSIGPGVSGTGEVFLGAGPCNSDIVGGSVGVGIGVSVAGTFEFHGGATETATQVTGSINVYQLPPTPEDSCLMPPGDLSALVADFAGNFRRIGRPEPMKIVSALPPPEALRRLADGIGQSDRHVTSPYDPQIRVIRGYVTPQRVRLYVTGVVVNRNSWRPVFEGQISPSDAGGSELTGNLAIPSAVVVVMYMFIAIGSLFFLIGLIGTVVSLAGGRLHAAELPAAMAAGAVVLIAFAVTLSVFGARQGGADGQRLSAWLRAALVAEPETGPGAGS
jgi:RHS repeat-associated protein